MKVLHITNWYYSEAEPHKVPFIKEHIEALNFFCKNELIHLEVQDDKSYFFKKVKTNLSAWESSELLFCIPIPWKIKELVSFYLLIRKLKKIEVNQNYDLINIHTAYPLCSKIDKLLKYLKIPLVFTEHWTAFSFNFNLPEESKSLDSIRTIYKRNVPVISVSQTLANDIKRFSKNDDLPLFIVPNVVRKELFFLNIVPLEIKEPVFFMVNYWREIKSPFLIFDAFKQFLVYYPLAQLRVGGYGPLWQAMMDYVAINNLQKSIVLLGKLEKYEVAKQMQGITAFVHAAKFETFSVVCAESLLCGTPVVVTNLPCVAEFVNETNGFLVENNSQEWLNSLIEITKSNFKFNREEIARQATSKFSKEAVGEKYFSVLSTIIDNYNASIDA